MCQVSALDHSQSGVDGVRVFSTKPDHSYTLGCLDGEQGVLMQYTGFKDKNGKEIYEGDIVRGYDYWNNQKGDPQEEPIYPFIADVKYGGYGDTSCHNSYGFYFDAKQSEEVNGWETPSINDTENCEVIGNIYENPELVK